MRSEHKLDADEQDAFSRFWRKYLNWHPGQLKAIKRRAHQRDRRAV